MKKKIIAISLVVAMLAIAVIGGTLAYFTDEDEATNVFTVGNVDITLYESKLHREAAGYAANDADEALYADGISDDEIIADAAGYEAYLDAQELLPGVSINKMPYVKNTGKSDAYVRIRVMIPTALNLDHLNDSVVCTTSMDEEFSRPAGVGKYDVDSNVTVDGVVYDVYTFIRNEALKGGEMTYWNVWNNVKMDTDVTMDDYNDLVAAGAIVNGQFNVLVQADAIQAATFANATEAFAAFDAQN